MNWFIPAKTFLIGEYVALAKGPALLLTTTPYFEMHLSPKATLASIPHASPAANFWQSEGIQQCLGWVDPYCQQGGLGASSAQFLGAYLASTYVKKASANFKTMLNVFYRHSWKKGTRPSGYDVIAQAQHGVVYINASQNILRCYDWPFENISFVLVHTGIKLPTHAHLQTFVLPSSITDLSALVIKAQFAFESVDSSLLVEAINEYHQQLCRYRLVASHSQQWCQKLLTQPGVLAVKGCGALGSDVLLLLVINEQLPQLTNLLRSESLPIMATNKNLASPPALIENKKGKGLEISA